VRILTILTKLTGKKCIILDETNDTYEIMMRLCKGLRIRRREAKVSKVSKSHAKNVKKDNEYIAT